MSRHPDSDRWVGLGADPLSVEAAYAFLADERAGGTCVFAGTPRRWTGTEETLSLTYEAYAAMAQDQLGAVVDGAFDRWPVVRAIALHRLGTVRPTEPSVLVGVATAHRAEAFEACRWLIDTLKSDVPIWKRDGAPAPLDSSWR